MNQHAFHGQVPQQVNFVLHAHYLAFTNVNSVLRFDRNVKWFVIAPLFPSKVSLVVSLASLSLTLSTFFTWWLIFSLDNTSWYLLLLQYPADTSPVHIVPISFIFPLRRDSLFFSMSVNNYLLVIPDIHLPIVYTTYLDAHSPRFEILVTFHLCEENFSIWGFGKRFSSWTLTWPPFYVCSIAAAC